MRSLRAFACAAALLAVTDPAPGAQAAPAVTAESLFELPFEELLGLKIVSVDKNLRALEKTPAAVYVLTRDDIRASGAETVADALRLVPGLHVGQLTSHTWAVGARGFNAGFNNKLLILVDGRSEFNPLFSGTEWSLVDVPLEQVERIEVVRGPGGTLWETKAMNGVVNVITRDSRETLGTLVRVAAGTESSGALAQQGNRLGDATTLRLWAKYDYRNGLALPGGGPANDAYEAAKGGFRLDRQVTAGHSLVFSGECFAQSNEDSVPVVDLSAPGFRRVDTSGEDRQGGNLLGRWHWAGAEGEEATLQGYYSRAEAEAALLDYSLDTLDVALNHRRPLGARNTFAWGLGFRLTDDQTEGEAGVRYDPRGYDSKSYSLYVRDEFQAIPDRLALTLGLAAEHNPYTGWELQPTGRFLWNAAAGQTVWGAVSRAMRTPSRADVAVEVDVAAFPGPGGMPTVVHTSGDPEMDAEESLSWEVGWRASPNPRTGVDVAAFFSRYGDLVGGVPGPPYPQDEPRPARLILPVPLQNSLEGRSAGVEVALRLQPADWWRINVNYTWVDVNLDARVDGADTAADGSSPEHQASALSSFSIGERWQIAAALRYVGEVPQVEVPAYLEGDLEVSWRPTKRAECALAGRNLLHERHPEYQRSAFGQPALEVERSVQLRVSWEF